MRQEDIANALGDEDPGLFDQILYKLLSTAGGNDLRESKREEIRQKRKEFIEERELMGGPPFDDVQSMEVLVELGMQESQLIEDFDPDLLIVSEPQYKMLFDIPAGIHLNPDKWPKMVRDNTFEEDREKMRPPQVKRFGDYHLDVVYSKATDRMLLADSGGLSTRQML